MFPLAVPPRRILVICLRRLGDVLLTTGLIRSVRVAWPQARIEVLVPAGSRFALEGNPDIDELLVQSERPKRSEELRLAGRLFRRYDLAISTLYNDRCHLYALIASGTRVTVVPPPGGPGAGWKRRLSAAWSSLNPTDLHTMAQYLALADCMKITPQTAVVPPRPPDTLALDAALGAAWRERPHAVVHPSALFRYKAWTPEGWRAVISHLIGLGLRVCLTGGPAGPERAFVRELVDGLSPHEREQAVDLSGRLSFAHLTPLIETARVFVGPDTSVTHLAAATGQPTIAVYGPSSPFVWGPWPAGWAGPGGSPWRQKALLQHVGNVWLVQGEGDCVPCLQEGCERHLNSHSDCLDQLGAARVIGAIDEALGQRRCSIPIHAEPAA